MRFSTLALRAGGLGLMLWVVSSCKQTKTATNADPLLPSTAPVIAPAKAIPAVETPNANNAAAQ